MNVVEVIKLCDSTNSRNEKVQILKDNDSDMLRYVLEMAISPFIVFGVRAFDFAEPIDSENNSDGYDFEINLKYLKFCLHHLRMRDFIGKIRDFIFECSKNLNKDQQQVLKWILEKDLKAGIDAKTVKQAFPGLIPDFEVSLCKVIELEKVVYPCGLELKQNGRRNISTVIGGEVKHWSRNGKENDNFHVFDSELRRLANGVDLVFDGEVSGNTGANKVDRRKEKQQAQRKVNIDTSELIYTIWDVMPIGSWKTHKCNTPYRVRRETLMASFVEAQSHQKFEKGMLIDSKIVNNQEELMKNYRRAIKHGNEGIVIKDFEGEYSFKRSNAWMKMKPTIEIDVPIVKILEGKGKMEGMAGSIVVDHKGVHVHCGIGKGITREYQREMWEKREELIGKIAEVVTSGETIDGSLEVGKFVRIRDDLNKDE